MSTPIHSPIIKGHWIPANKLNILKRQRAIEEMALIIYTICSTLAFRSSFRVANMSLWLGLQ